MIGDPEFENGLTLDEVPTTEAGVGDDQFADPMTGTGAPAGGAEDETRPGSTKSQLSFTSKATSRKGSVISGHSAADDELDVNGLSGRTSRASLASRTSYKTTTTAIEPEEEGVEENGAEEGMADDEDAVAAAIEEQVEVEDSGAAPEDEGGAEPEGDEAGAEEETPADEEPTDAAEEVAEAGEDDAAVAEDNPEEEAADGAADGDDVAAVPADEQVEVEDSGAAPAEEEEAEPAEAEMATEEEAQKAISMFNGMEFEGRRIVVNEARPLERR